jgi:hypothetical protein
VAVSVSVTAFNVTVPAATPIAAPQVTALSVGVYEVDFIELDVPPGPKGAVGFYVASGGTPVIPRVTGPPLWLVLDDAFRHYDLEGQPTSGAWQLVAYNVGNFAHTVRVTFGLSLVAPALAQLTVPAMIPASDLQS